jgi:glycosidase
MKKNRLFFCVCLVLASVFLIGTSGCSAEKKHSSNVSYEKMPKFSPEGGFYKAEQTVTITTTVADAVLYYTTDGSEPTESSTPYTAPITVNTTCVIRAVAKTAKEAHYGMTAFDFDLGATADASTHLASPDWQKQIVYLAMIDRFSDGDTSINVQGCTEVENTPAEESNFSGGDFQGLIDKLNGGYFEALGITSIWVTPPIKNQWYEGNYGGFHGYWASDFTQVDPHFGTIAKYKEFVALAHSKGIRVIQDIVVNHVGDYFTVTGSPYTYGGTNWKLNTVSKPTTAPVQLPWSLNNPNIFMEEELLYNSFYHWTPPISDYNNPSQTLTYQCSSLDDMNTDNQVVQNLLRGYFRYWIDKVDIDGFRVDTVKYVDPKFFEGFVNSTSAGNLGIREYAKTLGKNDFILFGEAWSNDDTLVSSYTQSSAGVQRLDSMIYFPLNTALRDVFGSGKSTSALTAVLNNRASAGYANPEKLVTFVDNHDMARFSSIATASMNKAAYAFIMTIPGIPQIYYGTEQDFRICRRAMFTGGHQGPSLPVNPSDSYDTSTAMFQYLKNLTSLRTNNSVFTSGSLSILRDSSNGNGILAYKLIEGTGGAGKEALVIFNTASESKAANNIVTGSTPGAVFTLQTPSVGSPASSLTVDSSKKVSAIMPAESVGIYLYTSTGSVPSAPVNAPTITSSYATKISGETITVTGTVTSTPVDILLFFDGNIASPATTLSLGSGLSTTWSVDVPLSSISSGTHEIAAAVDNSGTYAFSDSVSFQWSAAVTGGSSVDDPTGDDTGPAGYSYTLPTHSSYTSHPEDIVKLEAGKSGSDLVVTVTMRTISTVWSPTTNNFDHVLFNIFIGKSDTDQTSTAISKLNWDCPFPWDYYVYEEGWSGAIYNASGSSMTPSPTSKVDAAAKTVTFTIPASVLGRPASYTGWKVYLATWDCDMGNLRKLTPAGGEYIFGGGASTDPLVIDDTDVVTVQ